LNVSQHWFLLWHFTSDFFLLSITIHQQ
jgi:hypothetical protein